MLEDTSWKDSENKGEYKFPTIFMERNWWAREKLYKREFIYCYK